MTQKWNDERVETLIGIVGDNKEAEVSVELLETAAEALDVSVRSVASKLRNMDYTVASTAKSKGPAYTPEEEEELRAFVESNPGQFTYAEIAEQVLGGTRTAKQIQGKLLSMELFDKVKPTPKVEVAKKYSEEEEAKIAEMMAEGAYLEDIAEALGRELNSIRGKTLSMHTANNELPMPKQRESHAKASDSVSIDSLENLEEMTVAEIAETIGKTERGVKTMLTRRKLVAKDYDGAKKAAKKEAKAS